MNLMEISNKPCSGLSENFSKVSDAGSNLGGVVTILAMCGLEVVGVRMSPAANWDWLRLDSNHATASFMLND
ncbi:Uncharacterized protein TCM_018028 [Theobroma cacao]|uniref:Uncharacterized protein n=1 Tax=Theobroma cacao TaxID=3641 RepID=A0A061EFW2_THECC|nr:Uncharacterized protein TCM_018028 [Theobroma cacao]